MLERFLVNEAATKLFAEQFSRACELPCIIFLCGDLGVGKTTLSRYFIQALGYIGTIKSPTYTLIESYQTQHGLIFHIDLYRIHDARELEYTGIHEHFMQEAIFLIEWAEHGKGYLPQADIECVLKMKSMGREVTVIANTERGKNIVKGITP